MKTQTSWFTLAFLAALAAAASACGDSDKGNPTASSKLSLTVFTSTEDSNLVNSTILSTEKSVVLVDAQFTRSNAQSLADKIAASGKTLTTIYITHAHPDHAFGLEILTKQFPDARVIARPVVVDEMAAMWQGKIDQWKPVYKDDLTDTAVAAEPYNEDVIDLEGHEIKILGPVQGDTEHAFPLHVPELDALILGDIGYNGTHVWLAETNAEQRTAWLETLDQLEALSPKVVVSGHKAPSLPDDLTTLTHTRAYINDFVQTAAESTSAQELEQKMLALHGDLKLPAILTFSAGAALGTKE